MARFTSSILVTGGTHGLGYHCALSLARQCPETLIVIASRKDPDNVAASINKHLSQSNVRYMSLDLGAFAKVRDFVKRWDDANLSPLAALVLNAGVQFPGDVEYTPDGIEKHFGINHVGHALLFHLLLPKLTSDARIIVVASGVHDPAQGWGLKPVYTSPEGVAQPDAEAVKKSTGRDRYATSKVANVLWAASLGRHLASIAEHSNKTVLSFDPGLMFATALVREAAWPVRFLLHYVAPKLIGLSRLVWKENINMPDESGANLAWLTIAPETKGKKGEYFEKRRDRAPSEQAQQEEVQEALWRWTVQKVATSEEERVRFADLK